MMERGKSIEKRVRIVGKTARVIKGALMIEMETENNKRAKIRRRVKV